MKSRRAIIAHIALATEVPLPAGITFHSELDDAVTLYPKTLNDAKRWAEFLGVEHSTYLNTDGNTYVDTRPATWHAWKVHLWVVEFGVKPAEDVLPAGIEAALTKVACETADETTEVDHAAIDEAAAKVAAEIVDKIVGA